MHHSSEPSPILSLEDHLWVFWQKQKKFIFIGIAGIIVGLISIQGYHSLKNAQLKAMQSAYLNAITHHELEIFTTTYPKSPLGGLAYLELAKEAKDKKNISTAIDLYEKAFLSLPHHPLLGRIKIDHALLLSINNRPQDAIIALNAIQEDNTLLPCFLAEAIYQNALINSSLNQNKEAIALIERLLKLNDRGIWQHKGEMLRTSLPSLD